MSRQGWTDEPWWVQGKAIVVGDKDKHTTVIAVPHIKANADRIVACVNALKGFDTESLEKGVIKEMLLEFQLIAQEKGYASPAIDRALKAQAESEGGSDDG